MCVSRILFVKDMMLNGYPSSESYCVSWFIETKSDRQTQGNYRIKYGRDLRLSVHKWHEIFVEIGIVLDKGMNGQPRTLIV